MKTIISQIKKIQRQTKFWILFAQISPALLLLAMFAMYGIKHSSAPSLFYASWVILISSSLIWWAWIIKIVFQMIQLFNDILIMVNNIRQEIHDVKEDLKKD